MTGRKEAKDNRGEPAQLFPGRSWETRKERRGQRRKNKGCTSYRKGRLTNGGENKEEGSNTKWGKKHRKKGAGTECGPFFKKKKDFHKLGLFIRGRIGAQTTL